MKALLAATLALAACAPTPTKVDRWAKRSLDPAPNPFGPDDPLYAPQPRRDRPHAAALSADGSRLYVALTGLEDVPDDEVAVVDVATRAVVRKIQVGRAPFALALHPGGRFLVVANMYSNWLSVIDTTDDSVAAEPAVPWYTNGLAFSPDGARLYMTNRWKSALLTAHVSTDGGGFGFAGDAWRDDFLDEPMGSPTAKNPDEVMVSPDGSRVWVGAVTGSAVDVFDADARPAGHIAVHSPVGGMLLAGRWLVVSHIGHGTGHLPDQGVDGDENGTPGDGTGNVMFQDVQNELEVYDTQSLASVQDYTSDTICCYDYRDIDPDDPMRGMKIPAPETWPPSRLQFLPPKSQWIVAGALPLKMARVASPTPGKTRFAVVMQASDEVQRLDLDDATGALTPVDTKDHLYPTGFAPVDLAARPDGAEIYVVDRLGESITVIDPTKDPGSSFDAPARIVVGDESGGAFPATDVELGELFNNVTARITVDGDQACVQCHREGDNIDRVVAMPLQVNRIFGSRQVQAYRGAFDSRPWFLEAAMDQNNFFPVLNEFNRKENFCCEELDPLIWPNYPSVDTCVAKPATPGCNHVLNCEQDPPPECATRRYGSPYLTRDEFFLAAVQKLVGRTKTFGDSLRLAGTSDPIDLNFDGITRALGLFLLSSPRLPPNPNAALDLPSAKRGKELYQRSELGCATCHPLPVTAVAIEPDFSPSGIAVRLPPVITPTLDDKGQPADLVTQGFRSSFQVGKLGSTEQGPEGIHFGIPQLRGIFDRAQRFFHDGRSRSLRSALLTPGHPALPPGEKGFNERYGLIDTHGGTSQLTADEVDDLVSFLESL